MLCASGLNEGPLDVLIILKRPSSFLFQLQLLVVEVLVVRHLDGKHLVQYQEP
mgnify:CR=1 FL=1